MTNHDFARGRFKLFKKFLRWGLENLLMLLAFGAAFYSGYVEKDIRTMQFFIVAAAFFMVLRELSEIRHRLIRLSDNEAKGRHH